MTEPTIEAAYALGAPEGFAVPVGDGESLWVSEHGEGRPTVLLAGGGPGCTAWTDFAPVVPLLATDRRLVLIDMLNAGFSSAVAIEGPRWTAHARRIAAALKALGLADADFVCNSAGGNIAIVLAADYPYLVRKAVITGSEPVADGRGAKSSELAREGMFAHTGYYGGEGPTRAKLSAVMSRLEWWNGRLIPDQMLELRYLYSLTEGQRMLCTDTTTWGENEDLTTKMRRVHARMLFLFGKQDVFVENSYPVLLSETVPYGDVYLMDQAAHHMEEERPGDFTAIVRAFLDRPVFNS